MFSQLFVNIWCFKNFRQFFQFADDILFFHSIQHAIVESKLVYCKYIVQTYILEWFLMYKYIFLHSLKVRPQRNNKIKRFAFRLYFILLLIMNYNFFLSN